MTSHSLEFEYLDVYCEEVAPPSRILCTTLSPWSDWLVPSMRKRPMSVFDQVEAAATLDTVVIYSSKQPGALTLTTNQSSCTGSQVVSVKVSFITF